MNKANKPESRISELLKSSGQTLSTAESCTGGQIAHSIVTISGSSDYFLGGVVSYAIRIKESVLGVPAQLIESYGVVSEEVARAMAEGVKGLTSSTFSVATTGLAEGSDEHYPEGTVWIAASGPQGTRAEIFHCDEGRKRNIELFAAEALSFLVKYIEDSYKK